MELGALVCRARAPQCDRCPIADRCAWRKAGYPPSALPPRRGQGYEGTDRQARGAVLAILRAQPGPVRRSSFAQPGPTTSNWIVRSTA